ncbi:MAG TPA: PKD domain-containing protein, partial [Candidatus Thermoplasmatota archaeon]|nr:PKD domain-containing protein [Candidatus Thermoplasmatota archaeon]
MPLSRVATAFAFVLVLAFGASAGCIENMGDLKETLGVVPPPAPAPVYEAPIAKAQAGASEALVGAPIPFLSTGTRDPQELPLDLSWDFADGTHARGPTASHAFAQAGEYSVKLRVVNTAGLWDEDSVLVRIVATDRAPTVALRVADASGVATLRGTMGAPLTFEAITSDAEGSIATVDWDFGDGSTARGASATHAFAAPGAYDVRVRVVDGAGQVATAAARVAIDAAWHATGSFAPAAGDAMDTPIVVGSGVQKLDITLAFDAGFGLTDLEVVVLDASGAEVARSDGAPETGAQG